MVSSIFPSSLLPSSPRTSSSRKQSKLTFSFILSSGLYLAVQVPGKLLILSVHDGSTVREVVVPTSSLKGKERALEGEFFDEAATVVWEKLEDSSAGSAKTAENGVGLKKKSQDEEPVSLRVELCFRDASSADSSPPSHLQTGSAFGIINSLPLVSPLEASPAASSSRFVPHLHFLV